MSALLRFAAGGPAAVFPVIGPGRRARVEDLELAPGLEFVTSPRHAALVLVCGELPEDCFEPLSRIHDQLPHPRATVWWQATPAAPAVDPILVGQDDPAADLRDAYAALLLGRRSSEPPWLPDAPPNEWRGKGEHGQGGEGMMGGVPYGRPMAMGDDDLRDGLALDALTIRIGPFMPLLPPGLVLELTLQGDVVQEAVVLRAPFPERDEGVPQRLRQLARCARAHELRHLGRALGAAAARSAAGRTIDGAALAGAVRRSGLLHAVPARLGRLPDGSDARDRIAAWVAAIQSGLDDAPPAAGELDPGDLTGLEWDQLMDVILSVPVEALPPPAGAGR